MRTLGELISKELGWRVVGPLLPGHGTNLCDLSARKWSEWFFCVEEILLKLSSQYQKVHLVGLSMGASLCVEAFRKYPEKVASLSLLVPAIWLKTAFQRIAIQIVSQCRIADLLNSWPKTTPLPPDHVTYPRYSVKGLREFHQVCKKVRTLEELKAPPTIVFYTEADEVIHPKSAFFLAKRLKGARLVHLERSHHIVTIGEERDKVLSEFLNFYRQFSDS